MSFDEELVPEIVAGIRHHYHGLFQFGAPDVVVVNVDKDSVWTRKAVIPDAGNMSRPTPREAAAAVRPEPDEPQGDVPDAAAPDVRHPGRGGLQPGDRSEEVLPARTCIASRSPTSRRASRSMSARSPSRSCATCRRSSRPRRTCCRPSSTPSSRRRADGSRRHVRSHVWEGSDGRTGRTDTAIPLTVLTGFLGAGKTTLLNRILTGDHGLRIAVLVNDFGSINIDADLVVGVESDGDIISLANGCVCCNVRDDLVTAVTQVMTRPEQPEYILLEASGVAEPSSIALTFMGDDLRDRIRLDSIMCVVDAEQVFAVPEMMELKLRQVAFADMLILNKVDLVTPEEIEQIKAWLDDRFHRYRLVEASGGDVPLEILLSVGRFDPSQLEAHLRPTARPRDATIRSGHHVHDDRHDHSQVFRTWSYETDAAPVPGSAAGVGAQAAGQRLPMQGRRSHRRGTGPTGHPPGRRQAGRHRGRAANGMVETRGPGSSSSAQPTAWMKLRYAQYSTNVRCGR